MHWAWKNFPSAMSGQYKGKEKRPTIVLEAVADQRLWIWHSYFGTAGALNGINVLDQSTLFDDRIAGIGWGVSFKICGRQYNRAYYHVEGIYPTWSILIKAKTVAQDAASQHFKKLQEAFWKDIKRAFGVLQSGWAIISILAWFWSPKDMVAIMRACVILHNMIVEDGERKLTNTFSLPPSNGATSAIHVLYRPIHCIVFILDYKKAWRICIAVGNQYNTIHPKKMY
jgi:hypothetical protein